MPDPNDPEVAARIKLLSHAIELSGLSVTRFAVEVLIRDDRTVRRWLAAETDIPPVVRDFLISYVHDRTKRFWLGMKRAVSCSSRIRSKAWPFRASATHDVRSQPPNSMSQC
jgi:hypothetical protein